MGVAFSEESNYCDRIFKHMLSDYRRYDLLILGPPNKTVRKNTSKAACGMCLANHSLLIGSWRTRYIFVVFLFNAFSVVPVAQEVGYQILYPYLLLHVNPPWTFYPNTLCMISSI